MGTAVAGEKAPVEKLNCCGRRHPGGAHLPAHKKTGLPPEGESPVKWHLSVNKLSRTRTAAVREGVPFTLRLTGASGGSRQEVTLIRSLPDQAVAGSNYFWAA